MTGFFTVFFVIFLFHLISAVVCQSEGFCELKSKNDCETKKVHYVENPNFRYIFYDVNPPEGFNLRRDVYMRMAVFMKKIKKNDWILVLPPWPHLYHWISESLPNQSRLPWSLFFNITILSTFTPVIEMRDFFQTGLKQIEEVYVLQHFKDMFVSNNFEDRFEIQSCSEPINYSRNRNGYDGHFWGYKNLTAKNVKCLSFHGPASQLKAIVNNSNASTIMFDHAEIVLHDRFGDKEYWDVRKSMKFADHLVKEADKFRKKKLNSTQSHDNVFLSNLERTTKGDDYVCVHLRRRDFLYGHQKYVPSIKGAAEQIKKILGELKLNTVFVATDSTQEEKSELKGYLSSYKLLFYSPSREIKSKYKDGGVAIIEQIICSHARKFYGTYESTFSFRIQEEREIMGFPPKTTFNRLCGDKEVKCKPPSKWLIVQ